MKSKYRISVSIWTEYGPKEHTSLLRVRDEPLEDGLDKLHEVVRKII